MTIGEHGVEQKQNEDLEVFEGFKELWNLSIAFAGPFAMRTVLELNVPNIIAAHGSAMTPEQIAAKIKGKSPQPQLLRRVLDLLVLKKVFQAIKGNTEEETQYGLTRISKLLVSYGDNDFCLSPFVRLLNSEPSHMGWTHISDAIANGGDSFATGNAKETWEFLASNAEANKLFNDAMESMSKFTTRSLIHNYDGFGNIHKLVDAGGGNGATIAKIVKAYPHIHGINYDLPHVVASSPNWPGVEHIAGNAMESIPSGADAILMKLLLHGHTDENCLKILTNCYNALPVGGRVIVYEMIIDGTEATVTFDVHMLSGSTGGGERTKSQFSSLLETSGFQNIRFLPSSTMHSPIEAFKL